MLAIVLQYVLHLKESSPGTNPLKNNLTDAVDEVPLIWYRAGSKTVTKQNAIMRLKKEYKWQQLCKNKTCSSDSEKKCEIFAEALSKLWDIGAPDVIQTVQKNKMLSKERKAEDIFFFMKTSGTQEKVSLEGKMHCIRKAFKKAKKDLLGQFLSPS